MTTNLLSRFVLDALAQRRGLKIVSISIDTDKEGTTMGRIKVVPEDRKLNRETVESMMQSFAEEVNRGKDVIVVKLHLPY